MVTGTVVRAIRASQLARIFMDPSNSVSLARFLVNKLLSPKLRVDVVTLPMGPEW